MTAPALQAAARLVDGGQLLGLLPEGSRGGGRFGWLPAISPARLRILPGLLAAQERAGQRSGR